MQQYNDPEKQAYELRKRFGRKAAEESYNRNLQARERGDRELSGFWRQVSATIAEQLADERDERENGRYYDPPARTLDDDRW